MEDYVNAIRSQPDFMSTSTSWNFFLVTGEYDDAVKERITQKDRPAGLLLDKPTHLVWVKTWAELIRDCEARLHFVQQKLQIEVTAEEIEERISQLKASILRSNKTTAAEEMEAANDEADAAAVTRQAGE